MNKEQTKKSAGAGAVIRAYLPYIKRYPRYMTYIALGGILLQSAMLGAPLFSRQFFNLIASHTPNVNLEPWLLGLLGMIALMYGLEWFGRRVQGWANSSMQAQIMADLRIDSFEYLLGHSHNFFVSRFTGSLTHKVSKYASAFETLFDSVVVSFLPTLFFVVGAILILGSRNIILGVMLFAWTILFVAFQIYISRRQQPLRTKRSEADTQVTAALSDAISNQSAISLFSSTGYEVKRLRGIVYEWRALNLRAWIVDDWTWGGVGFFMIVIEIALLFAAMKLWAVGLLSVGDFVLIQAYLLTTFDRLVGINRELRRFYSAYSDALEMVDILTTPHEIANEPKAKKIKVSSGEIWFDDVSFNFNTDSPVLQHFNLKIKGGERVALVGPSGAGKSTVTKLLLRMYDVNGGVIAIDGQPITKVTQESLREAVSFVPQEPILFHRTLIENIKYGNRSATTEEVIKAAKLAHCHEFILKLPKGYETLVGERGIKLSGGERQRVAIARAILKNSPILVLDEATSSLDSESEALIQDALETLMQGKTVVVIAHRLSTIMKMDRIAVIEKGAVVAAGTHLELLSQVGLYAKLWSIQAGGFIGESEADDNEANIRSAVEYENKDELIEEEVEEISEKTPPLAEEPKKA